MPNRRPPIDSELHLTVTRSFTQLPWVSMEADLILRLKTRILSKTRHSDAATAAADIPRPGPRGWHAVASAGGSTTLWRRRGRLATVSSLQRGGR